MTYDSPLLCVGVSSRLVPAVHVQGDAAVDISAPVTRILAITGAVIDMAASVGSSTVDDVMDDSSAVADAIVVPVAPTPTIAAAALVPHVNDVQRFIDGLGPQAARHLQYISDNRVRCTACEHDITGGEEFRGRLTSRLQSHIATDAHGSRAKSLAGMSSISSYFSSASVASQSCGDPSDPVYERAVDRFLRQTYVFCVGYTDTEHMYSLADGSTFTANPMDQLDSAEDPTNLPPWVAMKEGLLSQSHPHLRDRQCAKNPYYAATPAQIANERPAPQTSRHGAK